MNIENMTTYDQSEQLARAEAGVEELFKSRKDRWYPVSHIASKAGWINDPNGLCYFQGRYHAYYQLNPFASVWGSCHWGHVSSKDLVTWRREPIAMAPSFEAERDGVFSGSAVISDDGKLVIYYTGHRWRNGINEGEGNLQEQCMAVSEDGVHFTKLGVVVPCPDDRILHFRDPKVWKQGGEWRMVFGVSTPEHRGEIWMYKSADMVNWEFDRPIYQHPDPDVFMLECPDMFPLDDKWVICYSAMGLSPKGFEARNHNNAGYVIGTWEPGGDFHQESEFHLWDDGHNYYAPQTFGCPDGRRLVFGWMSPFTQPIPMEDDGWCGQFTLPREVSLAGDHLRTQPIREFSRLDEDKREFGPIELAVNESRTLVTDSETADIEMEINLAGSQAERIGLELHRTGNGDHTLVCYDDQLERVVLDRHCNTYGDRGYRAAPLDKAHGSLKLRIIVDRGSIEVYVNDGLEVMSSYSFPADGPREIRLVAESGEGKAVIPSLSIAKLGTIWETPDR
ncbi:beta-fructofuranosidase [Bifidobacterium actinocoloniiforme DSM 22766]|uniref:Sucrose-6-phosphate hydrolase n=1 Tax=Bifidobacterium actinocoloniiforme DSM 22766 TaxID=1437605 RepID=A0A086YZN8_9BIFI|nr:glycoside hydrolase family 32 protein [Bifidobacterium actinocoloniiforme]AKV55044.1 beta-(1-2)-fructofuranosidase [Bifidobacterium actinocoloniiforme DSM 22766]KFI39738.1 beta-fructofuranosidase [Bifidobacterium actinocoloniiforme DSM 22766]